MAHTTMDRREFLSGSATLLVAVTPLGALACSCSPEAGGKKFTAEVELKDGQLILDLGNPRFRPLTTVGGGVKIDIPARPKPVIVTRVSTVEVAAFFSQCTHAGYEVLLPENAQLMCSSGHGALFDLRGNVLQGPAKSSLEQYEARLEQNRVMIRCPG